MDQYTDKDNTMFPAMLCIIEGIHRRLYVGC